MLAICINCGMFSFTMHINLQNTKPLIHIWRCFVALIAVFAFVHPVSAQTAELDTLFDELQDENNRDWKKTEDKIWTAWHKSGSDAIDHLLNRGISAMQTGDYATAIDHFSVVIDHAPDFAEAWNKRATVYYLIDEYGLSMADIQQTLALNPRHFGAMAGMGLILEALDQKKDALEVYMQTLEVHPHLDNIKSSVERLENEVKGTSL